jgi:HSP20 family protein
MSVIIRDPFETLTPLRDAMSRLFEESFVGPYSQQLITSQAFPVDIYETEDQHAYVVEATLPDTKPEQIQVTAVDNTLTIRVAEKQEEKVKKANYIRRERYEGERLRVITLPTTIDAQKVEAVYEHGVLTLHVPKTEAAKPKQIRVQVRQAIGSH